MYRNAIIYTIVALLQAGVIFYLVRRYRRPKDAVADKPNVDDADTYESLRQLALNVTHAQLGLLIPDVQLLVYGVVMDCNLGDGIVTLVAYITGAATIYFSNGEKMTGGGNDPETGEAASEFVVAAQQYISRAIQVTAAGAPEGGCVRFHLLSNRGMYAAQEQLAHITDRTSPWVTLFEKGNEVMELMHTTDNGRVHLN